MAQLVQLQESKRLVFGYGSNGTTQLRARVLNSELQSAPAFIKDYARVFCLKSKGWMDGGVASLAPCSGATTYGSVVELTETELELLDAYEGGYRKEEVLVHMRDALGCERECSAIAYIDETGASMSVEPSEPYLVAICCHLREYWNEAGGIRITVRSNKGNGAVQEIKEWCHPGVRNLSLAALLVEVNMLKADPWKMPITIHEVLDKLRQVGITETSSLLHSLASINALLRESGLSEFGTDTLQALRTLAA